MRVGQQQKKRTQIALKEQKKHKDWKKIAKKRYEDRQKRLKEFRGWYG